MAACVQTKQLNCLLAVWLVVWFPGTTRGNPVELVLVPLPGVVMEGAGGVGLGLVGLGLVAEGLGLVGLGLKGVGLGLLGVGLDGTATSPDGLVVVGVLSMQVNDTF
jgi:hypothetical protein